MLRLVKKYLCYWFITICCCLTTLTAQTNLLSVASVASSINDSIENLTLKSVDGPYLFRDKKGSKVITVVQTQKDYEIIEEYLGNDDISILKCVVNNTDRDVFSVPILDKIKTPKAIYKQPEKLLAISDIEGNFDAYYSLLIANGVMDKSYNWTFGKGHLVLIGDFMDRGDNVTQVLWLTYKLEQLAAEQGGMVHFILGNHEILNLEGKIDYVDKKYLKLAQKYSGRADEIEAYKSLMARNQELVRWLKSKNTVEKIGDILFVHGGISPELVKARLSIHKINNMVRQRLMGVRSASELEQQCTDFLMASHGPLWYRGLATRYRRYYDKATEAEVNNALRHFGVDHIAIGHTVAKEVSLDYGDKVIRTDVRHACFKYNENSQGLLVENDELFRVDAAGNKVALVAIKK